MTCTPATHDRLKRSTEEWIASTSPLGMQHFPDGGPSLELRNCPCGSTLARETKPPGPIPELL